MDSEHGEHGYESSGNPQSAPTRPGEGGYERGMQAHPEEIGRPGEPRHPGTEGQAAEDLETLTGQPATGPEDVLSLDPDLLEDSDEPDYQDDVGTTDVMLAVEEGVTYIPPMDPVVSSDADEEEDLEVLGGFASDWKRRWPRTRCRPACAVTTTSWLRPSPAPCAPTAIPPT